VNISLGIKKISPVYTDIQLAQKGDKGAFERLIEEHKYMLYRVAKSRLKFEEDIEDAFQETLIKAYNGMGNLRKEEYFKTWLVKIMINECNMIYRKRKKVDYLEECSEASMQMQEMCSSVEIFDVINSLEEDLRIVTLLYFYEDMPQKDIAKLLNIPHGTVRSRISRAKEKLRDILIDC